MSAFWDMPTLAELAGTEPPNNDGLSFLPALLQDEDKNNIRVFTGNSTVRGRPRKRQITDGLQELEAVRLYSGSSGTGALSNCMT